MVLRRLTTWMDSLKQKVSISFNIEGLLLGEVKKYKSKKKQPRFKMFDDTKLDCK